MRYLIPLAVVTLHATAVSAQQLEIYHIDVDQGESTLFVAPTGESLLVDSGNNGQGARIRQVLQIAGVTAINHYVTTHYHADHYGAVDARLSHALRRRHRAIVRFLQQSLSEFASAGGCQRRG